jgi:hypothetical protein
LSWRERKRERKSRPKAAFWGRLVSGIQDQAEKLDPQPQVLVCR